MSRILYSSKTALWPGPPRLTIAEKEIQDIKVEEIDLAAGGNYSPEYLAVNANATVPALKHDQLHKVLDDSTDICEFLNASYGGINLLPEEHAATIRQLIQEVHEVDANFLTISPANATELEQKQAFVTKLLQARISSLEKYKSQSLEHVEFYSTKLGQNQMLLGAYLYPEKAGPLFAKHQAEWEKAQLFLDNLNRRLQVQSGDYLVGTEFTLADMHVIPLLVRLKMVKRDSVFDGRSRLADYFTAVSARKSFQEVYAPSTFPN